jgi:hypothetical protein
MYKPFSIADIRDIELLEENIHREASAIWENVNLRRNRNFEELKSSVRQGKIAEQWLIENHGFTQARIKYHDVVNPDREYVEVKAYSYGDIFASFVQRDLQKYKAANWSQAKWYVLFNCVNGVYNHMATVKIK